MRFLYYDRVDQLEKGQSIVGIKSFPLSEEYFRGYHRKIALVPGVIFIESMAQLLGWLTIYSYDFSFSAVMSLIEGVRVTSTLRPGFTAEIHAELISATRRDSYGRARCLVDGKEIASIDRILYSHTRRVDPEALRALFNYYSGMERNMSWLSNPSRA
ncbi:MAG: hypothetical protein KDI63_11675 [Gammaproteobacteria bacterium]|nr:hypothetical protein [Gammaproteobacteria bacterium]